MNPKILMKRQRPEAIIQTEFTEKILIPRKWSVRHTHGNMFQCGFPDSYCCHPKFGTRWVDFKVPDKYSFTRAQMDYWQELNSHGVGVWIITAATEDQYLRLFKPQNWYAFLL